MGGRRAGLSLPGYKSKKNTRKGGRAWTTMIGDTIGWLMRNSARAEGKNTWSSYDVV